MISGTRINRTMSKSSLRIIESHGYKYVCSLRIEDELLYDLEKIELCDFWGCTTRTEIYIPFPSAEELNYSDCSDCDIFVKANENDH